LRLVIGAALNDDDHGDFLRNLHLLRLLIPLSLNNNREAPVVHPPNRFHYPLFIRKRFSASRIFLGRLSTLGLEEEQNLSRYRERNPMRSDLPIFMDQIRYRPQYLRHTQSRSRPLARIASCGSWPVSRSLP
jgi:hypothetical protein